MLVEKVIDEAYHILIDGLLYGIDDIYKEEICNKYLDYLHTRYSSINITEEKYKHYLKGIVKKEKRLWENIDINSRLQLFIKDKSFNTIIEVSERGFDLAKQRFQNNNTISVEEAKKNIEILKNELNNVYEWNLCDAKKYVSEGILDYKYASGNDELMSFRLYYIYEKNNSDQK